MDWLEPKVAEAVGLSLLVTTCVLMLIATGFAVQAHAQEISQRFNSVHQDPLDWAINSLSERITLLEGRNLDTRVTVLERGMDEIRWWTRGIGIAVLGQLVYMAFGPYRRGLQGFPGERGERGERGD